VDYLVNRPPEHPLKILVKERANMENKLNDYFRRRCSNYEHFLCDRVWECAFCARQAGKVLPVEELLTIDEAEYDETSMDSQEVKRSKWKE
jgi:hypothetical protein